MDLGKLLLRPATFVVLVIMEHLSNSVNFGGSHLPSHGAKLPLIRFLRMALNLVLGSRNGSQRRPLLHLLGQVAVVLVLELLVIERYRGFLSGWIICLPIYVAIAKGGRVVWDVVCFAQNAILSIQRIDRFDQDRMVMCFQLKAKGIDVLLGCGMCAGGANNAASMTARCLILFRISIRSLSAKRASLLPSTYAYRSPASRRQSTSKLNRSKPGPKLQNNEGLRVISEPFLHFRIVCGYFDGNGN